MAAGPRNDGDHAMIRILKPGKSEADKVTADREVRQTVEAILDDIIARGVAAGDDVVQDGFHRLAHLTIGGDLVSLALAGLEDADHCVVSIIPRSSRHR